LSDFHSCKEWVALSKLHKAIERARGRWKCADCSYKGDDMTSDHVLCVDRYAMFRLWLVNLKLRCRPCNSKKGTKFYISPRSLLLLGVYYSVKIITRSLLIACLLFVGHIVYLDLRAGPFDTTFFYQTYVAFYHLYLDSISLIRPLQ
jgi:hypothetical protein